jgi:hypothetical protein
MRVLRRVLAAAVTLGVAVFLSACGRAPIHDVELLQAIEGFEAAITGKPRGVVQQLLRDQAATFKGRVVTVRSATVASTYVRENTSNIYFGVNYDENDHLFLSEIDPPLHEMLAHHRYWVSVVASYPSRQLSYELPIDRETFENLEQGQEVSISCRIAALIRGRSVYCVPVELRAVE